MKTIVRLDATAMSLGKPLAALCLVALGWAVSPVIAAAMLVTSRRTLIWAAAASAVYAAFQFLYLWRQEFVDYSDVPWHDYAVSINPYVHDVAWSEALVANVGFFVAGVIARRLVDRYRNAAVPLGLALAAVSALYVTQAYVGGKERDLSEQYVRREEQTSAMVDTARTAHAMVDAVAKTDREKLVLLFASDVIRSRLAGLAPKTFSEFVGDRARTCDDVIKGDGSCDTQIVKDRIAAMKDLDLPN